MAAWSRASTSSNLRDAGDPVEVARRYEEDGADELVFLDITRQPRRPRHHARRGAARGRGDLHAVHRRRRHSHAGRCHAADPGRRREGQHQLRRGARRPSWSPQVARKFGRCATVVNIDPAPRARRTAGTSGKSTSTAAGCRPGWKRSPGRRRVEELGAGEIVLTSMDADGTKAGYDLRDDAGRGRGRAAFRWSPAAAPASPEHLFQVLTAGRADAALAASIFHYNEYRHSRDQALPRRARRAGADRSQKPLASLPARRQSMASDECVLRLEPLRINGLASARGARPLDRSDQSQEYKMAIDVSEKVAAAVKRGAGGQQAVPHGHEAWRRPTCTSRSASRP